MRALGLSLILAILGSSVTAQSNAQPSAHMGIIYKFGSMPRSFAEVSPYFDRQSNAIGHDFGNNRYQASISVHDVETFSGNSLTVGYLAGRYNINNNIALVSSVEFGSGSQLDVYGSQFNNNLEIGTIASYGDFEASLLYSSSSYSFDIQNWHASASYAFNDRLSGMVNYSTLGLGYFNAASVGLTYDVEDRVSISASATHLGSFSPELRTYALGLGLNF